MPTPNILLTRIDNRLIHGQVATQWNSTIGANLILVANDAVAEDKMHQNLMKMAAPVGVATRFSPFRKRLTSSATHPRARRSSSCWKARRMR
nr:PTS sugar transporter subunit IIB [Corynebacterium yudongzhengii]